MRIASTMKIGLAVLGLLGSGLAWSQAATDVNCAGCVNTNDIADGAIKGRNIANGHIVSRHIKNGNLTTEKFRDGAITTDKIADGAVTAAKLEAKFSNSIDSSCTPGEVVVGMGSDGNLVCQPSLYYPSGPQVNIPESQLSGWTLCHESLFSSNTATIADILASCTGDKLLMACRPVGATNISLLAAARRADVIFDTGSDATTTHSANGSEWYFNDNRSWGFARGGDAVDKSVCDYLNAGNGTADERMCMHTSGAVLASGYRCGDNTLNASTTWKREIYFAD